MWEEVRSLNDEGTTVFLTTQYLEEADQLAGRIAIIDGGTIVREGDPAALKEAVGDPTLRLEVADPSRQEAAQGVLAIRRRAPRPGRTDRHRSAGGTGSLASVIRALTRRASVGHVEVDSPSLDDVFADATGRRLEAPVRDAAVTTSGLVGGSRGAIVALAVRRCATRRATPVPGCLP